VSISILQVDSFTNKPFAGNPAAVCLLEHPAEATWMQKIAAEMNLSETAFVQRQLSKDGFGLRWFTPQIEVDLCGHATLATAHVLWEEGLLRHDETARFETKSGVLTAQRRDDWIELDFPSESVKHPIEDSAELDRIASALGGQIVFAGRNRFDLLVQLPDEHAVRALKPDMRRLVDFPVRGVIATSRSSSPEFDFVSRFFAPRVGVDEDPVCGSAHCCLGPFWAERLGRIELTGHQISARGGVVKVRVAGERVFLIGQAVTVLRGTLSA
jgi:PhzF family phenazine biosynthesis protein